MTEKFGPLDKDFERAFERMDHKNPLIKDAYGLDPLASDHFLLQRGWTYFKERIRLEEAQWEQIVKAKDEQIKLLQQELDSLKSQLDTIDQSDKFSTSADFAVRDLHLGEYTDIRKRSQKQYMEWEEERLRWSETQILLESQLKNLQEELHRRTATFSLRESEFLSQIKSIEEKAAHQAENLLSSHREYLQALKLKDEELSTLHARSELLRTDVDKKSLQLKEQDSEKNQLIDERNKLTVQLSQLNETLLARDREIEHVKLTVEIKDKEIAVLRSDMARQQAEWRESWAKANRINE